LGSFALKFRPRYPGNIPQGTPSRFFRLPLSVCRSLPRPPRPFVYQLIIFFGLSLIFKFSYLLHFMFVCPQISPTLFWQHSPGHTVAFSPLPLSFFGDARAVFARWCGPSSPDRLPGTCFSFVPPCAGTNAATRSPLSNLLFAGCSTSWLASPFTGQSIYAASDWARLPHLLGLRAVQSRSSSRYVFSFVPPCAGTNATTRSSLCCHQKPTFQTFYLQAAPLLHGKPIYVASDWARLPHLLGLRGVQSRSSSRFVLLLRAALCRHKCCHQKLTLLPPDAHCPILYLQAAPLLPGQPICD